MKYLRKIFENSEEYRLINSINVYNNMLKTDKIWKNYYKEFKNKYSELLDIEFEKWKKGEISNIKDEKESLLKDITIFAENRLKEIKSGINEHVDFIKDLYFTYLEDCESFEKYSLTGGVDYRDPESIKYQITLQLIFRKEMRDKSYSMITIEEVIDYWKVIYDFFKVLESNEYLPVITFYQTNGSYIEINIIKNII